MARLTFRKLWRRLRALVAGRTLETELSEELNFHLEMEAAKLRETGLEAGEARRRARIAFGGVERFREETRDARGLRPLDDLVRDLRHGVRTLARRPAFGAVLVLTLGVGVGGSAAIYGAVDGILLTPLPYHGVDRIFGVWEHDRKNGIERLEVAPANFLDWRERSQSFATLSAMEPFGLDWVRPDGPVSLPTWLVYERFFETLGTAPLLGRTFRPDEHVAGRGDIVVLGFGIWQRYFGGDPTVIGRVLTLDGKPMSVVGVMPEGFALPSDDVVWAPKVIADWERQSRLAHFYTVIGRLRDGATPDQAKAELDVIAAELERDHPQSNGGIGVTMVPLTEQIVGEAREALLLLLGAVLLVLAVVVANVASLQLARAAAREQEFAVRGALGAGRARVTRQLAAENLILAGLGAGLGFGVAGLALSVIRGLAPVGFPRVSELNADGEVLVFALGVSLVATLSTGILPTVLASRNKLQTSMAQGSRVAGGKLITRVQSGLVILQVCVSLLLLIGAGLLLRSFASVLMAERGFRTDGVATVSAQSWSYYPDPAARVNFVREVVERLAATPGVRAAGMASVIPLMEGIGAEEGPLSIEGAPPLAAGETPPTVDFSVVTPGYFAVLGIPLVAGRNFDSRDQPASPRVALVSQAFARRYFPEQDPINKRVAIGRPRSGAPAPFAEIIGVVGDVRRSALHQEALPTAYFVHPQLPTGANAFVIWGTGPEAQLLDHLKRAVWAVRPDLALDHLNTMADLVGASVRDRTFLLTIIGALAAMTLGLAAAGIFGLMSFAVGRRTREIGVRMAFGAERGQVVRLVLGRGVALAGTGVFLGLAGALLLTRVLGTMLYRVTPFDPITFGVGSAVLMGTAILASWYPARRAAATDPVRALHVD